MESVYSISVTNKFLLAALDEDEDPIEILKRREQEKEAKRKEKLSEKENRGKDKHEPGHQQQPKAQTVASKQQKPKPAKDASAHQNTGPAHQHQRQEQQARGGGQDGPNKRDQDNKKPGYQRNTGERNVKFSAESREEHYNKRNREDGGDRPPRIQNDSRRPYGGEGREPREYREPREFRNSGDRGDFGDRRPGRGGGGGGGERGGRGMGRGGYRGGRGGDRGGRGGYDNRGKREFDRQSGSDKTQPRYGYSGVKSMDKKDGAGSHNWGSHNDEIEDTLNQSDEWAIEKADVSGAAPDANESKDSAGSGAPGEEGGDGAPTEEKPAEEEPKELTLDEWKALQQSRSKPQYNLRKAGEGEDLSRWKKMYALEKKKEDEEDDDEEEYDVAEYPQRAGRQKHVLDIEINFNDSRRGAGGRGGRGGRGRGERGGGRGFGGRGGPRGGGGFDRDRERGDRGDRDGDSRPTEQRSPRERQNAPKVDDEHDFPSLG
ncbi:hypothetical protein QAD02_018683 [Eretmocerus hayati]|uniref:Uncharacterized protein n=1 Tax=Eretmocerus hayati TaxID=131215 RepID=A0ACC2PIP0_9HYME|nr:hypothetical protein QAD02_018683 [Eretmocerus hayati]